MSHWLSQAIHSITAQACQQASEHQNQLTKPQGSLGLLENIAIQISALQGTQTPSVEQAQIIIYASDHGIAQENVSAFPQAVTAEMVKNFSTGGAAISVLAKQHHLDLEIINLGLVSSLAQLDKVVDCHISCGTDNFLTDQAMTIKQMEQVFACVQIKIDALKEKQCQLFIGGEMGIANTTSASALVCALENIEPELLSGAGTGLDNEGIKHKADIIRLAIKQHKSQLTSPMAILCCLGGYEIVALCASYIRCAQQGIVSLVDGFICSVAALFAIRINPPCKDWLIFSHQSAEQGHKKVMQLIGLSPLLHFNMRLGEGSGAALSYPLLRSACLLHSHMASFAQAGVSEASVPQE